MQRFDSSTILSIWVLTVLTLSGCAQVQRPISPAESYLNRGVVHEKKGRHEKAISNFDEAIKLNPRYAPAYYNRGISYGRKGRHDKAISDFTAAIEIGPTYARAYLNRASVYFLKGEYEKAWGDVNKLQNSGHQVPPEFLNALREASGRQE
jgi:tetratricopeptide (TPR) repeat protein